MNHGGAHQLEEKIFGDALLVPLAERRAFLVTTCSGDAELMQRVEALLREHERTFQAVDESPGRELRAAVLPSKPASPERNALASQAAHYVLGEKLGEGGWGAVFAAEQQRPVRRSVAIKIVKLGMDTRLVVARFQAEQQALALMEHPGIARVFDAGATETGRPFFAMELVRGRRITEFCDEHRLTVPARLRLFVQVCDAVQHAHQKGVIHRDLKPSNILVSGAGDVPEVKVIDFGIAKATQGRLGEETVFTAVDALVGTPAYMSPEQAANQRGDIDTRSDIYSLGVLLYELLTGTTPLEARELREAAPDETRRRILESAPMRPSARVRALPEEVRNATAVHRQLSGAKLPSLIAGDLDWVVLRCLEKDRTRRYDSASSLARDIEHSLASETVTARPPSRSYELGKFVRRHRVAFGAAAGIALLLVAGAAVATALFLRERAALERAVVAERQQARLRDTAEAAAQKARAEARKAETEASRSREVVRFTQTMLAGVGPSVAKGRDVTMLREMLDSTDERLNAQPPKQPEVEVEMRLMVGSIYGAIAESVSAEMMYRRTLALQAATIGPDDPKFADTLNFLGDAVGAQRFTARAEECYEAALAIHRKALGDEHPHLIGSLTRLASSYTNGGKHAQARKLWTELLALQKKLLGPKDISMCRTEFWLARLLAHERRYAEAEQALREYLAAYYPNGAMWPTLGPGYPPTKPSGSLISRLVVLHTLVSQVLLPARKFVEAELAARESVALQRATWTPDPEMLMALSKALVGQKRWRDAEPVQWEAAQLFQARLERDPKNSRHWRSWDETLALWSGSMITLQRAPEAESRLRACISATAALMVRTPEMPPLEVLLAETLFEQSKFEEAIATYRAVLQVVDQFLHHRIYRTLRGYHAVLKKIGNTVELAALWAERAAFIRELRGRRTDGDAVAYMASQMHAMVECGELALAEALAQEQLGLLANQQNDDWQVYGFQVILGASLSAQKQYEQAEPYLLNGVEGMIRHHPRLPTNAGGVESFSRYQVEVLYSNWKRPAELAKWKERWARATGVDVEANSASIGAPPLREK